MPVLDILTVGINERQIFLSWFYLHFEFIFHVLFNRISFVLISDFVFWISNHRCFVSIFDWQIKWMAIECYLCLIVRWNMLSSFASNFPTAIISVLKSLAIDSIYIRHHILSSVVLSLFVNRCFFGMRDILRWNYSFMKNRSNVKCVYIRIIPYGWILDGTVSRFDCMRSLIPTQYYVFLDIPVFIHWFEKKMHFKPQLFKISRKKVKKIAKNIIPKSKWISIQQTVAHWMP